MSEKIQKVLARAGLGSRREIEAWIQAGLVKVNARVAKLGERVDEHDQLWVRGRLVHTRALAIPETEVILYHKPENELVTRSDEQGRETVFARLPKPKSGRWIAIGRLDVNTTGLLLFTNNGDLANRLMHPSYAIERHYLVRVFGEVAPEVLQRLQTGVPLDDGMARFDQLTPLKSTEPSDALNRWYRVSLLEGRNREVRRLWESQGVKVSRLKRIAFAGISLPKSLRQGKTQVASHAQINALLSQVGLAPMQQALRAQRSHRHESTKKAENERTSNHLVAKVKPKQTEPVSAISKRNRDETDHLSLTNQRSTPRRQRNALPSPHQRVIRSLVSGRGRTTQCNWRDQSDDYID